ncbi:BT_3987 domain-containing protein [Pedobacter faecalis]|uniref:BT_3987 domain-containing protein n=1 Tax=Pedobacter faecalis TaxID=3041495 RepID=UPI00254AAA69|nr:DUF1735 domain-containing protein [Pedobacter sp. ELA7]
MRNLYIAAVCSLIVLLTACSKENAKMTLPEGSVSFHLPNGKDTVQMPVSILKDTTTVLELKATLGSPSSGEHWVTFAVDSTKLNEYRSKYGAATLLPATSYLLYKNNARISANGTVSEAGVLNIGAQTKLTEYTTYVLPLVIKSVDGKEDASAGEVFYYVFKTGKPLFVNKTGWTIAAFSSQNSTANAATAVLDANNTTTYWTSNIQQQMPQFVSINFNREVTFHAVVYYLPNALVYPTQGGYPTSIQIETSMNGTAWVNKGIYAGNIVNKMQTIEIGETTARFMRFTVLAAVKYSNVYDAIFISGISLVP